MCIIPLTSKEPGLQSEYAKYVCFKASPKRNNNSTEHDLSTACLQVCFKKVIISNSVKNWQLPALDSLVLLLHCSVKEI